MAKAQFSSSKGFEDAQKFTKDPKPQDIIDVLTYPDGDWLSARFVGPLVAYGGHWLGLEAPNPKKMTKSFYKPCLRFDPETEERDTTKYCPYCDDETGWIRNDTVYYQNAIIRALQEDKPKKVREHTKSERKTGFKEKGSKSWTPVRALRITPGFIRDIKNTAALNRHKAKDGTKKSFGLTHPKYGCDVEIMYDSKAAAGKKYSIQKGDKSRLTEEEEEYLMQQVEGLIKAEKEKDAKSEYARWKKRVDKMLEEEGGKKGKKSKSRDDDDEDDEDEDDEDDAPKGKKGKKSKSREDDDEDEDEDSDDDEDEDEDSDDEDEDEDENEFKSKKSKKSKSKKSKKKSKKSKSRDEDEDEDDEDEDEDEDSDDEDEDDDD